MGITVAVDTVIGVRLSKDKIYKTDKVKAFDHNYPDTMKFCPETGKKLWKMDSWVARFPGLERGDDRFASLKLVNGPYTYKPNEEKSLGYDSDVETFYLGKSFETNGYQDDKRVSFISPEMIANIKDKVRANLEPLGLWDEKEFGIWTVLYVG